MIERGTIHSSASIFSNNSLTDNNDDDTISSTLDNVKNESILSNNNDTSIIDTPLEVSPIEFYKNTIGEYKPSPLANVLCSTSKIPDTRMDLCINIFPSLKISPILYPPEEEAKDVAPFKFDEPSPDDIVLNRQNQAPTSKCI